MNYVKNGWKVLFNYILILILFSIFSYIFLVFSGTNFNTYLPYYCFGTFIFAYLLIYADMKRLGEKEKKPQNELKPYPLKGFFYGLAGFLPIIVLEAVSVVVVFSDKSINHIKHIGINILMGPLYFIIRIFHESPLGYVIASLAIPVVAMLGYMAGYYGWNLFKYLKKEKAKPVEKGFTRSPWNPTVKPTRAKKKKTVK
jgi:hypothetical protein